MGIIERGDIALGLVQHQIDFLLALHAAVVELHLVGGQHLGAQHGDDLSVDRHEARRDEVVGLAARADARLGEETVQAHFARLFHRIVFRIRSRLVVLFAESAGLIGFVAEFAAGEFLVAEFLIPELLGAGFLLPESGFFAECPAGTLPLLTAGTVGVVTGLIAERAGFVPERTVGLVAVEGVARTVAVVEIAAGTVALLAVRTFEKRAVVGREMRVVRSPAFGLTVTGRLLRIGSISLQTRATLDTLRRSNYGALALVASEALEHRGRVVFGIFHRFCSTNIKVSGQR